MSDSPADLSLAQRTGQALAEALRVAQEPALADGQPRPLDHLLIDGIQHQRLPPSLDRARLRSPQPSFALAINTFLPWHEAAGQLPLAGWTGFEAAQFEVRCPTGLRGTPPHLDFLALRGEVAVAVTARCIEYLRQRKTAVSPSYDRLVAMTPGLAPWQLQLERLRRAPGHHRHLDLGALVKLALALGRTFPERPTKLLYLYWEPLNAAEFGEFSDHHAETAELADAVADARVAFEAQSFEQLWRDWAAREVPRWLADHVKRLRARYSVSVAFGKPP
jgi:hypothetical protein